MKDKKLDYSDPDQLVKVGALNVLALGYRGVELWRKHRESIPVKNKNKDEKEA